MKLPVQHYTTEEAKEFLNGLTFLSASLTKDIVEGKGTIQVLQRLRANDEVRASLAELIISREKQP